MNLRLNTLPEDDDPNEYSVAQMQQSLKNETEDELEKSG